MDASFYAKASRPWVPPVRQRRFVADRFVIHFEDQTAFRKEFSGGRGEAEG